MASGLSPQTTARMCFRTEMRENQGQCNFEESTACRRVNFLQFLFENWMFHRLQLLVSKSILELETGKTLV